MAKSMVGTVVSDKTDKTVSVRVVVHKTHPIYKKQYIQSSKFKAHDEKNEARTGDKVRITESKPISADKRFILSKIIERPILTEDNTLSAQEQVEKAEKKAGIKKQEAPKPKKEDTEGDAQ